MYIGPWAINYFHNMNSSQNARSRYFYLVFLGCDFYVYLIFYSPNLTCSRILLTCGDNSNDDDDDDV